MEQSWAEPERFEEIFRRYFGQIHRYLAARVGGRVADDLAAEVFTIAFAQRQRYDLARECARPWLYGIATNLAGTYRRQEQRRYRALARMDARGVAPSDEDLIAERVSAVAAGPALAAALAGLGSGDRDVLLLVAIAGLDSQEVAQSLGIPYGTVRSRLSRARTRLRESLGGANPADSEGPADGNGPADSMRPAGSGRSNPMDELSAVQRLLAQPPPGPDVVEAARLRLERAALGRTPPPIRAAGSGWRAPGLVRRGAAPRRWPGWLAPVAAAAAVAAVIVASLAISGVIQRRPAGTGPASSSGVFAKVPRYFVAIPEIPGRAVVGATATGAVLGTVAPPQPYTMFTGVAAAGDGRTFVFAAAPGLDKRPVKFYRLILGRSGHPGRLAPLPIPPQTATVSGLRCLPLAASSPCHSSAPSTSRLAPGFRSSRSRPGLGGSGCGLAMERSARSPAMSPAVAHTGGRRTTGRCCSR